MRGGGGVDTLEGGADGDFLYGEAGADILEGGTGEDTLYGGADGDTLRGGRDGDILYGEAGADILEGGAGDDTLIGGADGDMLIGGADEDTASYENSLNAVTVDLLNSGNNRGADAVGDTFDSIENLIGSDEGDTLTGDGEVNMLDGGDGDDILEGGVGADILEGGEGTGGGVGGGTDTASYKNSDLAVQVDLSATRGVQEASTGDSGGDTLLNIENIIGSNEDDTLTGDGEVNDIQGGEGSDIIEGGLGVDNLDGGTGTGTDTLSYANVAEGLGTRGVIVDLNIDSVTGKQTATDSSSRVLDNIENFENVIGSDNADTITGDGNANTLEGGAGVDTLRGGAGVDTLRGGEGGDTLEGGADGDFLYGDAGVDTLEGGTGTDELYGDAGNDFLYGDAGADTLEGGTGTDELHGGDDGDILRGGDNNDELYGEAGDDILEGDAGADTLEGGAGKDTLIGGTGNDILEGGAGGTSGIDNSEQLTGGTGADTYVYHYTSTRQDGIDTITEEAGIGNTIRILIDNPNTAWGDGNRIYFMNDPDPVINADKVRLFFDDSNYILIDRTDLDSNGDADDGVSKFKLTIQDAGGNAVDQDLYPYPNSAPLLQDAYDAFANPPPDQDYIYDATNGVIVDMPLTDAGHVKINLVNLFTLPTSDSDAQLKALLSSGLFSYKAVAGDRGITLTFGDGTTYPLQTLTLNNQPPQITFIVPLGGTDLTYAGATDEFTDALDRYTINAPTRVGDDTSLVLGSAGSSIAGEVTADFSERRDAVELSLAEGRGTGTFGSNKVAVLDIQHITGGSNSDILTGDDNANTLTGGAGGDTLTGGAGNDELYGEANGDTLRGEAGDDTLEGGTGIDTLYGGTDNDILRGGGDADTLEGGAGTDTLEGGAGADTYVYNYIGGTGDGIDTITDTDGGNTIRIVLDSVDPLANWQQDYVEVEIDDTSVKLTLGIGNTNTITLTLAEVRLGRFALHFATSADLAVSEILSVAANELVLATDGSGDEIFDVVSKNTILVTGDSDAANADTVSFARFTSNDQYVTLDLSDTNAKASVWKVNPTPPDPDDIIQSVVVENIRHIVGSAGADILTGNDQANTLEGGDGDDTLSGGDGIDSLDGGDGDDILEGGAELDNLVGGAGTDTLSYANEGGNAGDLGVAVNLATSISIDNDPSAPDNTRDTIAGFENVIGSKSDDKLTGDGQANRLEGGLGDDELTGGLGADTYVYNYIGGTGDGIDTITLETGTDKNIIQLHVDNPLAVDVFLTGSLSFVRHDSLASVRLAFSDDDYIVLTKDDIVNNRFALKISDPLDTITTPRDISATDFATAFTTYEGNIPPDFEYDPNNLNNAVNQPASTLKEDYIIDLSDLIPNFGSIDSLETLLASGRVAFFRTGTSGEHLKIVFVKADGSYDTSNSVTFADVYSGGTQIQGFQNLLVTLRDTSSTSIDVDNFGGRLTGATGTAINADTAFFIDGATQANFATLLNLPTDRTLEVTSIDDVLLAVVKDSGVLYRTYTLRDVPTIIGGNQADTFTGDAQANTFHGGGGNDILDGGAGADTLQGGTGADTLTGGEGNDILQGGGGEDTYVFKGASGRDTITEVAEAGGVKTILRFEDLTINAGWQQRLTFTINNPDELTITFVEDTSSSIVIVKNYALETLEFQYGTSGNVLDIELGTAGDNTLLATTDAQRFVGFAGSDTVSYADSTTEAVEVDLSGGTPTGAFAMDDTFIDIENLIGGTLGDTLTGNDQANTLTGGAGADTLSGGDGVDSLDGGEGADILIGGLGVDDLDGGTDSGIDTSKDTLSYANEEHPTRLGVAVNLATSISIDNDLSSPDNTRDTIAGFENVIGSRYDDTLTGDGQANRLEGGAGDDELTGGLGADTYVYYYTNIGDTDERKDGADTIRTEADVGNIIRLYVDNPTTAWTTDADDLLTDSIIFAPHDTNNVRLAFSATDYIVLSINDINDMVATNNKFTLKLSDLAETVATMRSVDAAAIKTAFDAYLNNLPANFIYDTSNRQSEAVPATADDYIIDLDAASIDGFDAFTTLSELLASGRIAFFRTGTDGADLKIVFVDANGVLNSDNSLTFTGAYDAAGTPTAAFANLPVVFRAASGRVASADFAADLASATTTVATAGEVIDADTAFYIDGNSMSPQVDFATLLGSDKTLEVTPIDDVLLAVVKIGTDLHRTYTLRDVTTITGGNQADTFTGDAQANTFHGGGGNDILDGGEGADTLQGGTGADTLTGGEGNDILQGGLGIDTYVFTGDSGSDTITEVAEAGGVKTILLFEDLLDPTDPLNPWQDLFTFALSGTADLTITFDDGTNSAIVIVKNYAQETLEFRYNEGLDTETLNVVLGTAGADTLLATTEAEHFVGFAGTDRVSYATSTEALTLDLSDNSNNAGAEAVGDTFDGIEELEGGSGDDTLTGDGNVNELYGGDGADTLSGGAGADFIDGEGGVDTVSYKFSTDRRRRSTSIRRHRHGGTSEGSDTLAHIENIIGSSHGDTLTGDDLDNEHRRRLGRRHHRRRRRLRHLRLLLHQHAYRQKGRSRHDHRHRSKHRLRHAGDPCRWKRLCRGTGC